MNSLQTIIEQAWENRALLQEEQQQKPLEVIELLDAGKLRLLNQGDAWQVNEWVKKVVMYFPIQKMETWEAGIFDTTIKWN
jgi:2,3,4,5-tetrahydropyridine-2-carboxylate N-succinyltransferase